MRIIFANNYYYQRGGSERVFFDEMDILTQHNHNVIPFSRVTKDHCYSKYQEYFTPFNEFENVSLLKKIQTSINIIYSRQSGNNFKYLINIVKPDIIHGHNIYGGLTTSIIDIAKIYSIPFVMTLHDYKLICPSYLKLSKGLICEKCNDRRYYNCVITRCHKNSLFPSAIYAAESYFTILFKKYNWVKYLICPSQFCMKKHFEGGIPINTLVHIPNFVRNEKYEPNHRIGDYILFVGRLSKEKGILTLLKAMKGINFPLVIVGDGIKRSEYEKYVQRENLKNIFFKGYRSGEELKTLFQQSNFLVFTSEWYENAPIVVLEAFACGKPVVGSNIGGTPEMVIDGQTGLLFEPGNPEDLREKIHLLINNPTKLVAMGKNARKKVEEEYNANLHYQRLLELYKKACS